jgi:glycosyltransferase involved in cell wall biosynthesis
MATANVVAMPSWEEPFSLVALEAVATAKPVVATRAGGVPEFVLGGETGLLIPPRDPQALAEALIKLIDNPQLACAMGQKGRLRVEKLFTAQRYAKDVAQILSDAL